MAASTTANLSRYDELTSAPVHLLLANFSSLQIMELMRKRTPAGRQDRSLKEEDAPIFKHLFGELATYVKEYFMVLNNGLTVSCAFVVRHCHTKTSALSAAICKTRSSAFRYPSTLLLLLVVLLVHDISAGLSFFLDGFVYFEQYDLDNNKELSPREFGMFLVSHVNQVRVDARINRINRNERNDDMDTGNAQVEIDKWVERVENLQSLKVRYQLPFIIGALFSYAMRTQGNVSEQEFMDFNVFLEHLDEMKVAIDLIMQEHGLNKGMRGSLLCS